MYTLEDFVLRNGSSNVYDWNVYAYDINSERGDTRLVWVGTIASIYDFNPLEMIGHVDMHRHEIWLTKPVQEL